VEIEEATMELINELNNIRNANGGELTNNNLDIIDNNDEERINDNSCEMNLD
jgi:hypothetical protein